MKTNTEYQQSILIVDDTVENLQLLSSMLEGKGYDTRPVPSGQLALQAVETDPPDLILLDINMPQMNGYEVCERLKTVERLKDIPVIFISALDETTDKVAAFNAGGVDFMTKPFQFEEVLARVETHLELRQSRIMLKRQNEDLQQLVDEQVKKIIATQKEMSLAQLQTITAISKIAEARDDDTGKHIERTQTYCRVLAERLREYPECTDIIDDQFCVNIYHASPLHDIGKVAISDAILNKPGKLTKEEFETMKKHAEFGARNLEQACSKYPGNAFINMGIVIARSHHEKWNGSGYPEGLSGDEIPLAAQIMAVADVYDALRSERCYKPSFSHEKSRNIIISDTGTHFSPLVGNAFETLAQEFEDINATLCDS